MMMDLTDRLLLALPALTDPNFRRTVVYVFEYDATAGAFGLILNRPSRISVAQHLPMLAHVVSAPEVVHIGGPVQRETAITVAVDPVTSRPVLLGDEVDDRPCRVFSGYSGWEAGQLMAEIVEGAWHVADPKGTDILSMDSSDLWSATWRRQPGNLSMLATYPIDPRVN